MKKAFPHNFKPLFPTLPLDVKGVNGYTKAMTHFYSQIADMTQWKPENRYIDATVLLDMIAETNGELSELMKEEQKRLQTIELNTTSEMDLATKLS